MSRFRPLCRRFFAEPLETRRLLAITSGFGEEGKLSILVDGDDDVRIEVVDFFVKLNGEDIASPPIQAREVASIVIVATGEFSNEIDLAAVGVFSFLSLTLVTVDAGPGDDNITAPAANSTLSLGEGTDTMFLDSVMTQTEVVITDSVNVALGASFVMEADSQLVFLGDRLELIVTNSNDTFQMRNGSSITTGHGEIMVSSHYRTPVVMQPGSLISSTTGSITLDGLFVQMEDGSRIT